VPALQVWFVPRRKKFFREANAALTHGIAGILAHQRGQFLSIAFRFIFATERKK